MAFGECLFVIGAVCFATLDTVEMNHGVAEVSIAAAMDEARVSVTLYSDFGPPELDTQQSPQACEGDTCASYFKFCNESPTTFSCSYHVIADGAARPAIIRIEGDSIATVWAADKLIALAPPESSGRPIPFSKMDRQSPTAGMPECRTTRTGVRECSRR